MVRVLYQNGPPGSSGSREAAVEGGGCAADNFDERGREMFQKHRISMLVMICLLAALAMAMPAAAQPNGNCDDIKKPRVEIFMNQQPVNLVQGETRIVTLSGAVYDNTAFNGDILFAPNGPQSTACPIFFSGENRGVSFPPGPDSVRVRVTLRVPANTPPGNYNCALRYSALFRVINVATCEVGKGNQVNIPYQVRRR